MASTNMFDLLNDDAPDQTIHVPAVKETKPAAKSAQKQPAAAAAAASKPADTRGLRKEGARPSTNRPGDTDAPRGPRYDRYPIESEATNRGEGRPQRDRGSRAPRGGRGGRHGGYDRHSGTGIVDSEKKEIQRLGDPAVAELEGEKDAVLSAQETSASFPAEPAEPEEVVKTLDEFLAEKAAKALKVALPKARAANAGADDSQWKNAKVLEVEETGDFIKMGKDSVTKSRKTKKEAKVLITDIDIRYTEPARDPAPRSAFRGGRGGDRGGRGGDRGARGSHGSDRGARRGGAAPRSGTAVNVDDQELFPSLGSQ